MLASPLFLLGFFFNMQNFPALVMATIWANRMGKAHFTAIAALNKIYALERILCTPAVSSTFRKFTFWKWNHSILLSKNPTRHHLTGGQIIHKTRFGVNLISINYSSNSSAQAVYYRFCIIKNVIYCKIKPWKLALQ